MSKAQNRADTIKWKKRRKNHFGDKCKKAKCTICHPDKKFGKPKPKYIDWDSGYKDYNHTKRLKNDK